jgi:hypothetical protein
MSHCALLLAAVVLPGGLHPRLAGAEPDPLPPGAVLRLGEARFRAGGEVLRLDFSPDGSQLLGWVAAPGGPPRQVAWDAATGRPLKAPLSLTDPPEPDPRKTPAVRLRGDRVLTAGPGNAGWVWDAGIRNQVAKLTGHSAPVTAVAASPDGKVLATGDAAGLVRTWDAETFRPAAEPRGHTAAVRAVEVSADGKRALTTGADGSVRVWDLLSGRELRGFPAERAALTPDGGSVFVPAGGRFVPRDVVTGLEVVLASGSEPPASADPLAGLLDRLGLCFTLSPDGRSLAFAHSGGTVGLYELASGQLRRRLPGHLGTCRAVAFTPNGSRLLTAGADHSVLVWAVRVQDVAMPAELKRETSAAKLWDRMTRGDAAAAYLAMARLAADPGAAVKMARLRLKPGTRFERLAEVRAVELLESVGTEEAVKFLEELAAGDPETVRVREAKAALARITVARCCW